MPNSRSTPAGVQFLSAIAQSPELTQTLMAHLAQRLHESKILLELRGIRSAQKRVLHYLRLLIQPNENTIVHEIRNPLTTMMMGLNHARKQLVAHTDRERLDLAIAESQRLKRLLDEILLYG